MRHQVIPICIIWERHVKGKTFERNPEGLAPSPRFPGVDAILGPEMRSTGEVMGVDDTFGMAYLKSQQGAGQILPEKGTVFISLRSKDKRPMIFLAKKLVDLGFQLAATKGTAKALARNDIPVTEVFKVSQGRPHVVDMMKNGEIHLIINTPGGKGLNRTAWPSGATPSRSRFP